MYYLVNTIALLVYFTSLSASNSSQSIPAPVLGAIQTVLNKIATNIPQGLLRLNEYNNQTEYNEKIDIATIENFLNQELIKHHIDLTTVTYLIGKEGQDWQFINFKTGSYGLVIPEATAQVTNLIQRLIGHTNEIQPEYELNIEKLNKLLSQPQSSQTQHDLARYKLAITKALVQAASTDPTILLASSIKESTLVHASMFISSKFLSNALSALSYIYDIIPEHNRYLAFQQKLDEYILSLSDLDIIQAHLEDLREQLKNKQGSYITKLWSYIPVQQNQLEQRIQVIEDYYQDLRLIKTISLPKSH